jgi:hypothetical protein
MQAVGSTAKSKMMGRTAQTSQEAIGSNVRSLSYELDFSAAHPTTSSSQSGMISRPEEKTEVSHRVLPHILDFANEVTRDRLRFSLPSNPLQTRDHTFSRVDQI